MIERIEQEMWPRVRRRLRVILLIDALTLLAIVGLALLVAGPASLGPVVGAALVSASAGYALGQLALWRIVRRTFRPPGAHYSYVTSYDPRTRTYGTDDPHD